MTRMSKILITGATGNIAGELIKMYARENVEAVAAVTDLAKSAGQLASGIELRKFDFTWHCVLAVLPRAISAVAR